MEMGTDAVQWSESDDLAGEYIYERVGFDARPLELLAGGKIGRGIARIEKTWSAHRVQGVWELSISGQCGLICRLFQCEQGVFRGHWLLFERMPIALTAIRQPGRRTSEETSSPRLNPITGLRQRSAVIEQLGHSDISVVQIVFGCLRAEKLLCKDGSVESASTPGERWQLDGNELILQSPNNQDVARYGICDNPREMHGKWMQDDQPLSKIMLSADPVASVSPESVCIVIGSFEQPAWAIANARASKLLNPGCPILVFDNCSSHVAMENLRAAAREYGFQLQFSVRRHSHYPGDLAVLKAGFVFARECGASYLVRCNQRTIHTRPRWATEVAMGLATDNAAVAYQSYWGEPHKIRTEMLAFSMRHWEIFSSSLEYGKLASQKIEGILFEHWFYRLVWELFPWKHTSINWFSRRRTKELEFTVSYYNGTTAAAATAAVDQLSQRLPQSADLLRLSKLYSRAQTTQSDICEHVPTLRLLASQCKRVVEFGVRSGVSTAALLSGIADRPGARLIAYDIERSQEIEELAAAAGEAFTFVQGDSRQVEIDQTDLLFIDTFHSASHLWDELTRHEARVGRWLVLHDTTTFGETGEDDGPGLLSSLQRFLREYPAWSILAHYENNNGLTILKRTYPRACLDT